MENGIATAEDFKQAMTFGEPERVRLPKLGKHVLLRRPNLPWFIFKGLLPISVAARASNPLHRGEAETLRETAERIFDFLTAIMVNPRCVLYPQGNEEISPDMIDIEDAKFMIDWANGKEVDEAHSLETFRRDGSGAESGATGAKVELSA